MRSTDGATGARYDGALAQAGATRRGPCNFLYERRIAGLVAETRNPVRMDRYPVVKCRGNEQAHKQQGEGDRLAASAAEEVAGPS
jgi:hypothetical protein